MRCCLISRFYRVIVCDDNAIVCDNVTSSHFICNGTLGSVVHLVSVMSYICGTSVEDDVVHLWYIWWGWWLCQEFQLSPLQFVMCNVLHRCHSNLVCIIQPFIFNSSVGNMYRIKHKPINWYNLQHIVTLASQSNYASRKLRTTHAVIRLHLCQELAFQLCCWWW